MPDILSTPPPQGATPVISDAPPPAGVTAGPQISDAPPPGVAPVTGWQAAVKPLKLPNGIETVIRPDGYVWLDDSKVAPGEQKKFTKEGWHTPDLWGGWKKGPDAPKNWKPTNAPHEMGDLQIATQLLGMTPEQYLQMATAADYRPGQLAAGFDNPNGLWSKIAGPQVKSVTGGLRAGFNAVEQLAYKPLSWMGNKAPEMLSAAKGRISQINQNLNQGRPALEEGFDPLHTAASFAPGAVLTQGIAPTAAPLAQEGRIIAMEEAAKLAGRETPGLAAKAGEAYLTSAAQAPRIATATAITTPRSIKQRVESGLLAGIATPAIETGINTVVAPGIQKLFNFAGGLKDLYFGKDLKPLPGTAGKVQSLADKWGVDVFAGNQVENPASQIRTLQEHATAAPVGSLSTENVAQQAQATRAVKNFQNQLKSKMMQAGYDNFAELTAAKEAGEKQAVVLWNMANDAGNDLPRVIAANGNINRWAAQQKVNRLAEAARASDTGAVAGAEEMAPALTTVDRLIKEHGPETVGEANVNKPLLDYLKRVKKDLTTKNVVKASTELNASGDSSASIEAINRLAEEQAKGRTRVYFNPTTNTIVPVAPTTDSVDLQAPAGTILIQKGVGKDPRGWTILDSNIQRGSRPATNEELNATLQARQPQLDKWHSENVTPPPAEEKGSDFKATYSGIADYRKGIQQKRQALGTPGSELTGNDATKALKELQTGIEQTQELTSKLSPGTAAKDRLMRETHLKEVVPFKKRALINMLSTDTPDVIANRMANMTEDQLAEIVPQLGEKGKAAARLHMVTKAVELATDRTNPNVNYQFQPVEFAKKMTDPKFAASVGLTVPKGGEGRWELNGLVELMGHLQTAGKTSSAEGAYTLSRRVVSTPAAAMKWLLTTRPGKQLLLQASDLKAGSPQFAALVDRANKLMPAEIGKASSTEENQ